MRRSLLRPPKRASPRRLWTALGLILASLAAGALLAEGGLRLAGVSYPFPWTLDEARGIALRPGAEGWYREEGEARFRINGDGMRDRERTAAKPAGVVRIAVLGDSMTEALQVAYEASFPAVLERRLSDCAGLPAVEVLNFGVSGYSTAQELVTLRRHVWKYDPDLVLLAFLGQNDVRDNSRALSGYGRRPYFVLADGRLVLDDSFGRTRGFRLQRFLWATLVDPFLDRSRLLQLANRVRRNLKAAPTLAPGKGEGAEDAPPGSPRDGAGEPGLAPAVYREPKTPAWREAWEVTERLLLRMRDEVEERGRRFVLVTLPVGVQVQPDAERRRKEAEILGAEDILYPEARLQGFARANGIRAIDLVEPMQKAAAEEGVFFHGFPTGEYGAGHLNAAGHRRIGEMLALALCPSALNEPADASFRDGPAKEGGPAEEDD